jgi:hypothetical protein
MKSAKKRVVSSTTAQSTETVRAADAARQVRTKGQPALAAVSVRRMTQEEERQLDAVLDLFLREIVREQLDRQQ